MSAIENDKSSSIPKKAVRILEEGGLLIDLEKLKGPKVEARRKIQTFLQTRNCSLNPTVTASKEGSPVNQSIRRY